MIVRQLWEKYRAKALPADASPEVVNDHRLTFYAASHSMLATLVSSMHSSPDAADAIELIDTVQAELREFFQGLAMGRV